MCKNVGFKIALFLFPALLMLGCQSPPQTTISTWLAPNSPAQVTFPLSASAQSYSFNANPAAATVLTLHNATPDLNYTAEIRDGSGSLVATLGGNAVQNAVLTISPANGLYVVTVKADGKTPPGSLSMLVSDETSVRYNSASAPIFKTVSNTIDPSAPLFNPVSGACNISAAGSAVNIRSGPGLGFGVIGSLAAGTAIPPEARGDNGWFQIKTDAGAGWISGSVIVTSGTCDALAVVKTAALMPTAFPTAMPAMMNTFQLDVDHDGWGNFSQQLSAVDRSDLVWLNITHLTNTPLDNYREFAVTLICSGPEIAAVRWGSPEKPALACGQTIAMPFMTGYQQQPLAVTFNGGGQVAYNLMVVKH
jgi:hypothetical protein